MRLPRRFAPRNDLAGRLAKSGLKGLSPAEFETLELLLDDDASETIAQSLKEIKAGKRIHIDEW